MNCCVRFLLLGWLASLPALAANPTAAPKATAAAAANQAAAAVPAATGEFPQQRAIDGNVLTLYAPQVRTWPQYQQFTASIAFALTPAGQATPKYGTATVAGSTAIDMEKRLITILAPKITDVTFADPVPAEYTAVVMKATTRDKLQVPVDLFLAHVADDVLAGPLPAGFNTAPPPILVRSKPTALLFVNGTPVPAAVPNTTLEVIVNANWPLYRTSGDRATYYLLARDQWLTSSELQRGWKAASTLPDDFNRLPAAEEYAAVRKAVPLQKAQGPVPQVVFAERPTELVVTEGTPRLETIADTDGLEWVSNTDSPLFKLGKDWYFLVAGRWFRTTKLEAGPWTFVQDLPKAFASIPTDHARAAVRASVPGTLEAKMATLEASMPTTTRVRKGSAPTVDVTYAGDPKFEAITGTQVARAVNSGFDVFMYQNRFYLCYAGAWYVADAPTGPWGATAEVPAAIYSIPPNSPAYAVTDVKAKESSGDDIEYSSTGAYAAGVFVAMGVAYYGTGWYYPPYIYGPAYYPYWGSYGHGSWYNPATGGYGSRSVWYGPYGGYSYTQGYNPRTGRYGYVETGWDGDEWGSFGETYNPRTGVGTKTERYYDEDKNKLSTERKVERGDEWVKSERKTDFDDNTTNVERSTSRGGSSDVQRTYENGAVSTDRTVRTAGGDTYTATGEQSRNQGSSTITGAGGTATTETVRNDGRSATTIEGSGGGQAISVSGQGPGNRATVAQSGSGDVYAGYGGNIYKKTDNGWQQYSGGNWTPADTSKYQSVPRNTSPTTAGTGTPRVGPSPVPSAPSTMTGGGSTAPSHRSLDSREYSQLQRDYEARQMGNQRFQQRSMGSRPGGGFRRGR